ncbi:MAG: SWIM zinc finger family protein [Lachnospiraceae bacterium]|nr:SWIM zinc finger family protein [Lachnospiraceae bacterium]
MDWRNLFQAHILDRGYHYYCEHAVEDVELGDNIMWATVYGTQDYEVEIRFKQNEVIDMDCSCPYAESGNNCKHMAAVLYEWEDIKEENQTEDIQFSSTNDSFQRGNDKEQLIKETIASADETIVRTFLQSLLLDDEKLWMRFKSILQPEISEDDLKFYKRQVDAIEEKYLGRDYFINYYEAMHFIDEIYDILDQDVCGMMEDGNYKMAFELINYIFIMIGEVEMDDSDGGISIIAARCCDLWYEILDQVYGEDKSKMLRWFLAQFDSSMPDYMQEYIENVIMEDFLEKEFLEEKLQFTDKMVKKASKKKDSWYREYYVGNWAFRHLALMEQNKSSWNEKEKYCKQYWQASAVRKYYIDQCIQQKKYDLALEVLKASIEIDADYRGLVKEHHIKMKEIYQTKGDVEKYQEQLWELVLKYTTGDLMIFRELKSQYPEEEWNIVREKIFSKLPLQTNVQLYKEEKLYDRLMEAVQESGGLWLLQQYESELKKLYPDAVLKKYEDELNNMARLSSDRKRYKQYVSLLRRMKKIKGGTKVVERMVSEWRILYKRRPAMMDELSKL